MILRKNNLPHPAKGGSTPAFACQRAAIPRCLVRICNLFLINHKIANWKASKNAIAAGKTILKNKFASQMWATRPRLGSIFEKLLHRKTFYSPAARCLQSCDFGAMFHVKHSELLLEKLPEPGSARLGHIPSLPGNRNCP